MISEIEAIELTKKLENLDIDIQKTIEKATTAGYLGEDHFYCTVIEDGGISYSVPDMLGENYKTIELDNLYYDVISKALDKDGIYISLAYCNPHLKIPDEEYCEIVEYDDYELEDDDYYYLMEYSLITADEIKKFKIYAEEGISGHEATEDIGIMINIIDGEYKSYFAIRSVDLCSSFLNIFPITNNQPKEHPLSIKNPINRLLIEMIYNTLVLK